MKGNGDTLRKFCGLVSLFRNGTKATAPKVAELLGRDQEGVRHQIMELHDAGLLRIAEWEKPRFGQWTRVYEWAEPFGSTDAIHPILKKGAA